MPHQQIMAAMNTMNTKNRREKFFAIREKKKGLWEKVGGLRCIYNHIRGLKNK